MGRNKKGERAMGGKNRRERRKTKKREQRKEERKLKIGIEVMNG